MGACFQCMSKFCGRDNNLHYKHVYIKIYAFKCWFNMSINSISLYTYIPFMIMASNEYENYRDIKTVYCIHREFYA